MSTCPTLAELDAALAGEDAGGLIIAHVQTCESCGRVWKVLCDNQSILSQLHSLHPNSLIGALDEASRSVRKSCLPPDAVPGYRLASEQPINRGGQGHVYLATHVAGGRKMAIKVLAPDEIITHRQRSQFEREIKLTVELDHPNIVKLYEAGLTSTHHRYYVMEHIDGSSLDQYVHHRRTRDAAPSEYKLTVADTMKLFAKICDALRYAHRRRIIHCDLKPGNILVDCHGEPHVLDFGLASSLGADPQLNTRRLSVPGEFRGTINYAAPEQVDGQTTRLDRRTDVYALGVILFEMLTGRHPYSIAGSNAEVAQNILTLKPERPSRVRPDVDREIDRIVSTALAKSPQRRYPSAEEMYRDVQSYLAGPKPEAGRGWWPFGD